MRLNTTYFPYLNAYFEVWAEFLKNFKRTNRKYLLNLENTFISQIYLFSKESLLENTFNFLQKLHLNKKEYKIRKAMKRKFMPRATLPLGK